ncbi:MAG: winged helix-turn-helix domain-containing protein [Pirellulales bacterium]|nr:winged helix-turn-helix domain-containing protein [Pirellulales bacterium]
MTKKKTDSSNGHKSAVSSERSLPSKVTAQKSLITDKPVAQQVPASDTPTSKQTWSNDQIGKTAGIIWLKLEEEGGLSLAALKKEVQAPSDLVLAAIGWLAREDKLEFVSSGRSVTVSLR